MFIFLLRQKNEPKKTLCEKYASAPLWHFSQYCIRRVAPHIFTTLRLLPSLRAVGEAIYLYCFCIPYGMHRSVKRMHIKQNSIPLECYLVANRFLATLRFARNDDVRATEGLKIPHRL